MSRNGQPDPPRAILKQIAERFGTPAYAFDLARLRKQVATLREAVPKVEIFYSLKANASLGICEVFADEGIGADVASAGELETALAAGFPHDQIFVAGPFKAPETIERLLEMPQAIVSVDSLSELRTLSAHGLTHRALLRLRPDFGSCAVVQAGSESRFGFTCEALNECREFLSSCTLDVCGFHVFAGSQVLDAEKLNGHLRAAYELSVRSADTLGIAIRRLNLGGGFGTVYGPKDKPLDLNAVAAELNELVELAGSARVMLEFGRYLVAESGYYLTSVLGHQTFQGRSAVVVDGGVHQRADMCGMCLRSNQNPPLVLKDHAADTQLTDILGCLSLPDDVLLEASPLPPLSAGDVIAFANTGAYGIWSSPAIFHGSPLPAEIAFEGSTIQLMRERKNAQSILDDQRHIRVHQATEHL